MKVNMIYIFVVKVSSDKRTASQNVSVTVADPGSPRLYISNSFTRFNADSKLQIFGYLNASYSVTATWSVYNSSGDQVALRPLTPNPNHFTSYDAQNNITFPLSIAPGLLAGGSVYTFRLTAVPTAGGAQSFTQISLTANSPPTGGYILNIPNNGKSLTTLFVISSPGWTSDVSNLPLRYSFAYRLSSRSKYLTIAELGSSASTNTTLPAGLASENNYLILQGLAVDVYAASSATTGTVLVDSDSTVNIQSFLIKNLPGAFARNDFNLVYQIINNVSLYIVFCS